MNYSEIDALNFSSLAPMADSPLHCRWRSEHEREDTAAMLLGRAVHCMVLEPERFSERYFTPQFYQCDATTKGGTRCSRGSVPGSTLCKQHGGQETDDPRERLTREQTSIVVRCSQAIAVNPAAANLLEGTERERVITWDLHGVKCKGRLDAVASDRVIDIKTTRSLSTFAREQRGMVVAQDAARRLYHAQLAWYRDGWARGVPGPLSCGAYIIAVETSEPYDSAVFRLPPYVIEAGRSLYQSLLDRWLACRELGQWPGRYQGIVDLELPSWAPGLEEEEGF